MDGRRDIDVQIVRCNLPVGGTGFRGAVRSRPAAYWSSWADSLEMIQQRHEPEKNKIFWFFYNLIFFLLTFLNFLILFLIF